MNSLDLPPILEPGFTLRASYEDNMVSVVFTGNADMNAIKPLETFLKDLHKEAQRMRIGVAQVDLRELTFMNSSCFKSFVRWINQVQDLTPDQQYRLRFVSNPTIHWQRRSLHALRCFATHLITLDT